MIVNPGAGSGGIKLLAHGVVTPKYDNQTMEVQVPTSLFALVVVSRYCYVTARGGANNSWSGAGATLSADGNTLAIFFSSNTLSAEYWAFG